MEFKILKKPVKDTNYFGQFDERMKLFSDKTRGVKSKYVLKGDYTKWELFCEYIVIRCYRKYLTIHTNGDLSHYEMKRMKYEDVRFETNDADFLSHLLDHTYKPFIDTEPSEEYAD